MNICVVCNDNLQVDAFTSMSSQHANIRIVKANMGIFEQFERTSLIINANCEGVAQSMSELYVAQTYPEAWQSWQKLVQRHGIFDEILKQKSIPVGWATSICVDAKKQRYVLFAPCRHYDTRVEDSRDIITALFAALQLVVLCPNLPRNIMCIPVGTGYGCTTSQDSARATCQAIVQFETNCMAFPPTILRDNELDTDVLIYNHSHVLQRHQIRHEYTFV